MPLVIVHQSRARREAIELDVFPAERPPLVDNIVYDRLSYPRSGICPEHRERVQVKAVADFAVAQKSRSSRSSRNAPAVSPWTRARNSSRLAIRGSIHASSKGEIQLSEPIDLCHALASRRTEANSSRVSGATGSMKTVGSMAGMAPGRIRQIYDRSCEDDGLPPFSLPISRQGRPCDRGQAPP